MALWMDRLAAWQKELRQENGVALHDSEEQRAKGRKNGPNRAKSVVILLRGLALVLFFTPLVPRMFGVVTVAAVR